ncbi:hypothetical protein ACHAXR_004975 [Thalassiosira sp. AJA248-18]
MTTTTTMLANSPSSNPSSSSTTASAVWITALVGAIAALGLWTKQQQQQRQQNNQKETKSGRRRSKSSSDDEFSDTISVEGSVMVTLPTWAIASLNSTSNSSSTTGIDFSRHYHTDQEMMSLAIHLSDRNISEDTGGPFGAAIFERHYPTPSSKNPEGKSYCKLVSIGMNRVVPLGNSTLHGEMIAIQLAQRKVGSFTLMLDVDGGDGSEHCGDGLFYDESREDLSKMLVEGGEEKENGGEDKDATTATTAATAKTTQMGGEKRKRQFELFTSCEPCAMCLGATLWSGVSRMVCGATKADAQAIGFDEGPVFEQSYEHLERCGVVVTRNVLREEAAKVLRRYGNSGLIYNR